MSDLRDRLAREIREALGDRDDTTQPIVVLVRGLVDRIAELEAVAEAFRYDNNRLRAIAEAGVKVHHWIGVDVTCGDMYIDREIFREALKAAGYLGVGNELL